MAELNRHAFEIYFVLQQHISTAVTRRMLPVRGNRLRLKITSVLCLSLGKSNEFSQKNINSLHVPLVNNNIRTETALF